MIKTNDNSKEYTIFITCKGGKPYSLLTYNNLFEAKQKLYEMINLEKERRRNEKLLIGKIILKKKNKITN